MSIQNPKEGPDRITAPAASRSWITEGGLVRATWRLATPMMVAAMLEDLFALVDMFFVGKLGEAAIAAVAVSGAVMGVMVMLAMGVTTGATVLIAQAVGAKNRSRAEKVAAQSLMMSLVLSAVVAVIGVPLAQRLLEVMGAAPSVVSAGTPYLQIMAGTSVVMFLSVTFASAMRGAGDAVVPLKVLGVCNLANIVLDPIMIFGSYGVPPMGVAGSAWATAISRLIGTAFLARMFFVSGHEHFHLRLRDLRPDVRVILDIFRIGVFGSAQMLMRNVSALVLVKLVAPFGTVALAAYGIGIRLLMTSLMIGLGFGNAAATIVGQNLGAGKTRRAEAAGWLSTGMFSALGLLVSAAFLVFAERIVDVFNSEPAVVAEGANVVRWLSATFVFTAFSVVIGRAMNGAGDTFWPMLITGVSMVGLRIPLAYVLSRVMGSATGVWVGIAGSNIAQGALFAVGFWWGRWKTIGENHARIARLAALEADAGGNMPATITDFK